MHVTDIYPTKADEGSRRRRHLASAAKVKPLGHMRLSAPAATGGASILARQWCGLRVEVGVVGAFRPTPTLGGIREDFAAIVLM